MSLDVEVRHRQGDFVLDAAFAVDEPGVTALFGPSGAGKSTLVQAIAGLLRPAAGRIVIDGKVVFDAARGRHVPARRRGIGYVFQDGRLFPHLSVADNLRFGARRARGRQAPVDFAGTVELLGLGPFLARRPQSLSGGERQRVALGRALLAAPRLLLLDEPLSALDAARKAEILPFLARVRDEAQVPMIYVTHALDEITRLADTLVLLEAGSVRATAPVVEALARLDLVAYTGALEAGAVIEARVVSLDPDEGLSEAVFDGGTLWLATLEPRPGAVVRVRIRARDVILARDDPGPTSANIVLRGEVRAIAADGDTHADVQVAIGSARLLARVTRRSLRRLELSPGVPVTVLVKTVSIES